MYTPADLPTGLGIVSRRRVNHVIDTNAWWCLAGCLTRQTAGS